MADDDEDEHDTVGVRLSLIVVISSFNRCFSFAFRNGAEPNLSLPAVAAIISVMSRQPCETG
jgi:hypothetical protein